MTGEQGTSGGGELPDTWDDLTPDQLAAIEKGYGPVCECDACNAPHMSTKSELWSPEERAAALGRLFVLAIAKRDGEATQEQFDAAANEWLDHVERRPT